MTKVKTTTKETIAAREGSNRRHEAAMDKLGAEIAKEMGPVRVIQLDDDPVLKAFNEVMDERRRRKVN